LKIDLVVTGLLKKELAVTPKRPEAILPAQISVGTVATKTLYPEGKNVYCYTGVPLPPINHTMDEVFDTFSPLAVHASPGLYAFSI